MGSESEQPTDAASTDDLVGRRAFFFQLAKSAAGFSAGGLAVYGAAHLLYEAGGSITRPTSADVARSLLDELLEDAGRFEISCGRRHILLPPGTVHPDIRRAGVAWKDVFSPGSVACVPLENCPGFDWNGNIVALGSPGSNEVSRLALGMEGPMDELRTRPGPRSLRFEYVHARSEVERRFGTSNRYGDRLLLSTPNWVIVDCQTGEEYVPRKDEEDFISSDYLLLSRLPNTLTSESLERATEIVVAGGAHGVGLAGLASIILEPQILRRLQDELRGCRYFQALFAMYGISHDHTKKITRPGQFKLIEAVGYSGDPLPRVA